MHVRQHIAKQKITNHASVSLSTGMGNVRVTISDKRLPQCSATVVTGHTAYVISATDYSPFGAPLPGRTFAGEGYRFGFNGQERDDEVSGNGNSYTTEFRQYDSRLGKWLCVDPETPKSPWASPYVAFGNDPIYFIDSRGDIIAPWYLKNTKPVAYPGSIEYNPFSPYYSQYTNFTSEANMVQFTHAFLRLTRSNKVFAKVVGQLHHSNNIYNIAEPFVGIFSAQASYNPKSRTIQVFRGENGLRSSDEAIFEEIFHAGQDEFYSNKGISRSFLADEVEAKAANLLSNYQDDAVTNPYSSIKEYFTTGKKEENFDGEVDQLITSVYNLYSASQGSNWKAENKKENLDKATLFSYLESLYLSPKAKSLK